MCGSLSRIGQLVQIPVGEVQMLVGGATQEVKKDKLVDGIPEGLIHS